MKDRSLAAVIICGLIFLCSPLFLIPLAANQLFPRFEEYVDTELLNRSYEPDFALPHCRLSLIQEKQLLTTESRNTILSRLPAAWSTESGETLSYFDQVSWGRNFGRISRVNSWIHYDSATPGRKPIHVRNSVVLQLC